MQSYLWSPFIFSPFKCRGFVHSLKPFILPVVPWNLWNLMELRSVFKRPFWRETSLKKVNFIPLVWLMHKDEGNKGFSTFCQIKSNFDNFIFKKLKKLKVAIPYLLYHMHAK